MYCINCGSEIRDGVSFCDACGIQIKSTGRYLDNTVSDVPVENPVGIHGEIGRPWVAFISFIVAGILALLIVSATVFNVDIIKLPDIPGTGDVESEDYYESDGDESGDYDQEDYSDGNVIELYDNDGNQILIDVDDDGYIMPDADTRVYEDWEISSWDEDRTQYAINELYARHGQDFDQEDKYEDTREYEAWLEENTSWYYKIDGKMVNPEEEFSDIEYENFKLLGEHRDNL